MQNLKRLPLAILVGSIICLSACGGMTITTWLIDAATAQLVRKDSSGTITDTKSLSAANGYRCYSESDDTAWRDEYATAQNCCNSKTGD